MKVIAITGRSASGKSTVSSVYKNLGFTVLDADLSAKKAVSNQKCLEKLVEAFGMQIISNGQLNRKLLAKTAFESADNTKLLTDITHPFIENLLLNDINTAKNNKEKIVFVDGAVIIGFIFEKHCDEFIVVTSPIEKALKRIIKRDGISRESALMRLDKQLPEEEYLKAANYIIKNNYDKKRLEKDALDVLNKVLKKV